MPHCIGRFAVWWGCLSSLVTPKPEMWLGMVRYRPAPMTLLSSSAQQLIGCVPLPDLHLAPALHPPPNHPFAAVFNLNSKVPQRKSQPLHTSHITCTIQPSCCSSTGQATCFRTSSQRRSTNGRRSSATFPSSPYTSGSDIAAAYCTEL